MTPLSEILCNTLTVREIARCPSGPTPHGIQHLGFNALDAGDLVLESADASGATASGTVALAWWRRRRLISQFLQALGASMMDQEGYGVGFFISCVRVEARLRLLSMCAARNE